VDKEKLQSLLSQVQTGNMSIEEALEKLSILPYDDLGYARLDLHRSLRTGIPEIIFCQSKTIPQVTAIFERLSQHHDRVLGTRATPEMAAAVQERISNVRYDPVSRLLSLRPEEMPELPESSPYILVACAGTTDLPVAEEAAQTIEFLGSRVMRAYDVGVAGIHRLLDNLELIRGASVIISVAGMEGALTSVIGGLAACPVIGVPTSVGYGASFNGLAALLAMLNSCAAGVAVVNIDNGFGAGVFAHRILNVN
jgi:pyridinium-3,5-biscarboxylic acid mononucleotide synthase